jgi:hypothetical protein
MGLRTWLGLKKKSYDVYPRGESYWKKRAKYPTISNQKRSANVWSLHLIVFLMSDPMVALIWNGFPVQSVEFRST